MKKPSGRDHCEQENPEWSREDINAARSAGEVLPQLFGEQQASQMLLPRRGRPRVASPKQAVSLRLDADVLARLRATGPGWQTRLNDALKVWLREERDTGQGD